MIVLLAVGCGSPISNAPFYADEAFLAAVPDRALLGMPPAVQDADAGDDPVLAAAIDTIDDLDHLVGPLAELGEAIIASEPTERHETYRVWDGVPATVHDGDDTFDVWVRAELVQASELEPVDWTIEVGATRVGPWTLVASGAHGTAGGELTWDVDAAGALVGLGDVDGAYAVTYDTDADVRTVEIAEVRGVVGPGLLPVTWWLLGVDAFGWIGTFEVTSDDAAWPGSSFVRQIGTGGRAEGTVLQDGAEVGFERCWDARGDTVFAGGDAGTKATGDASACVLDAFDG